MLDIRQSFRTLAARKGLTAVAVATLALGIGATTAIYTVIRNVLLRPLPYDAPDRIVQVWNPWTNEPGGGPGRSPMSSQDYADVQNGIGSFEYVAAYTQRGANLEDADIPERIVVTSATAAVFDALGVQPQLGRTFTAEDDAPGRNDVVVLSHELWQRRFGRDPAVVGAEIRVDGATHRIIGVMPRSFRMPADYLNVDATDVWKPLGLDPGSLDRSNQWLHMVARLESDASIAGANAELAALTRWWIDQGFKIRDLAAYYAVSIEDELFGGVRPALLVLFGAVGFVLLIACANVANLLLARADERRTEIAMRTALGASPARIVTQLLTESLLLAALGGAAGVALAYAGIELLVALEPANLARLDDVHIDATALGFAALITVATSVLFGLAPALQATRTDITHSLVGSRTMGGNRQRARFRGSLAIAETALSVVLVIGATLLIRTFVELRRIEPGFDPRDVLTFSVSLPSARYVDAEQRVRLHAELAARLERVPGVTAAGAARALPLAARLAGGSIQPEGAAPPAPGTGWPNARWQIVTPGYFDALRYTPAAGRLLEATDRATGAPVVVINETLARMFWPGQDPVGRRLRNLSSDVPWFTVVGVVRDVRHSGITDNPSPTIYYSLEQVALTRGFVPTTMSFAIRTPANPLAISGAVREAVRSMDPTLPVAELRTMEDIVSDALAAARFTMLLLAIFAAVALVMAIVGIYGLLSHAVTRQWREIGIRTALGATRTAIVGHVVAKGMRLACAGLAAGLAGAILLTRALGSLLYGVEPLDPATFLGVTALFALVALAATYIPARRAAGVDPMVVLRHE